jgi:two-component system, NarL family, sensor histidine kinase UhpB
MSLFWRVFSANAAALVVGIVALGFTPVSISKHASLPEVVDLIIGLLVMMVANWLALRPLFRPLERLAQRMDDADVLHRGLHVPVDSGGEVGTLERAFNKMMVRFESERREAGARTLRAEEEQRRRIARGLHDEVGQTLTGVLFQLKGLARNATPEQAIALAEAQQTVKASLGEVRRIAQELRPEVLDHLGLSSALTNLSRSFSEKTGIYIRRQLDADIPPLDPEIELVLYRVAQESLTNAARHSGASEIVLALEPDGDGVVLRVFDNGQGLNGSSVEGGGLRGIRERALIVGAAAAIKNGASGGVEVRLRVPAKAES